MMQAAQQAPHAAGTDGPRDAYEAFVPYAQLVLSGVPQGMLVASSHRTSSKLDATLLISTLQGQKVGTIGNGRKAGSKRLFKQRPWEFDFLDAHDEPRFRLRRLPGSQKTTAEVYERGDAPGDANWRKMG